MPFRDSHLRNDLVELGFRSVNPRIGHFPHILAKSGALTLRVLASALDVPVGLWGLWKLEANQRYLFQRSTVGPNPTFKMFISANTPANALQRTYEHFDESSGDIPYFEDYIDFVCDWISDLRWVFIPLEGEVGWSIFAGAHDAAPLVSKVQTEFQRNQVPFARLTKSGNRLTWDDQLGDKSAS